MLIRKHFVKQNVPFITDTYQRQQAACGLLPRVEEVLQVDFFAQGPVPGYGAVVYDTRVAGRPLVVATAADDIVLLRLGFCRQIDQEIAVFVRDV